MGGGGAERDTGNKKLSYQCLGVTWVKLMTSSRISFFAFSNSSFCAKGIKSINIIQSCFHTKSKNQNLTPSSHVLDNLCVSCTVNQDNLHLPTHLLHAFGQAWHLNIQGLYKGIREWDHNCFDILSDWKTRKSNWSLPVLSWSQRNTNLILWVS